MPADAQKPFRTAYFSRASCAAPFVGALAGLVPMPRPELIARVLIGIAVASAVGMLCAAIAIKRRERPWWLWTTGIVLNTYPFLWFLFGLFFLLGAVHVHM